jgi:hypothetical protein
MEMVEFEKVQSRQVENDEVPVVFVQGSMFQWEDHKGVTFAEKTTTNQGGLHALVKHDEAPVVCRVVCKVHALPSDDRACVVVEGVCLCSEI